MPKKGYNYNFKMFMEGIEVPFQSANIICSPNGVEASINCHSNEQLLELKPKTAVQIFYKDWVGFDNPGWHLLCDCFLSRFDKNEESSGGVGIAIQVRDFRMDIRKAPAALSYNDAQDISGGTYYHTAGVFQNIQYKIDNGHFKGATRTFDNSRLNDLSDTVIRIARTAAGGLALDHKQVKPTSTGSYYDQFAPCFPQATDVNGKLNSNVQGHANGGFFLDAFVRGIWMDAAGGTKTGTFLNKRIRVDKRFMVPINKAGYDMWFVNNCGQLTGEAAMADSQFGSIEAIIMRIAALFMVRIYSCNTPSLISLADDSPALDYVIDKDVRHFCVKIASKEFGPPYILNSSMLLPPLEFTAPPDCNLIFPCMYHRVVWQYDMDAEITRGYFTATDCFGTQDSQLAIKWGYQVPNGLFMMPKTDKKGKSTKSSPPDYKANRLTLEERYKGVNVMTGTVEEQVAYREISRLWPQIVLKTDAFQKFQNESAKQQNAINEGKKSGTSGSANLKIKASLSKLSALSIKEQNENLKQFIDKKAAKNRASNLKADGALSLVLKHHALLKFINTRYAGRVITVEMSFNPYLICGFPAIVIADDHGDGFQTMKSMIGMVQQVKHFITRDGEAVSSVVINNVRFIDEPTDMDENGNPTYCKETDAEKAIINDQLQYFYDGDNHTVGDADAKVKLEFSNDTSELDLIPTQTSKTGEFKYAKDFLTVSRYDLTQGKVNGIYLDRVYEPNRISIFYKNVFGQRNHFMVGRKQKSNGSWYKFMYDSIHEAIENITTNKRELLSNYEQAIDYIKRNVCCEEAFFCGILGLSIKGESTPIYFVKTGLDPSDQFDPTSTRSEYFGISTKDWKTLPDELKTYTIKKPGMCSSITETSPRTAFIEERKDSVRNYLKSVLQQVEAVSFSNE